MRKVASLRRRLAAGIVAGLGLGAAVAAPGSDAALPPEAEVLQALRASPAWEAARHERDAQQAAARQTRIGPQEWSLSATTARRRDRGSAPPERTSEWELGLQRPWRLPGKARLAGELGEQQTALAGTGAALAWREQARELLALYTAWLREQQALSVWQAHAALLRRQAAAVQRRRQLGDAAPLEALQAQALLAQAEAQAQSAAGRERAAREALQRRHPGLGLPGAPGVPETVPQAPPADGDDALQPQLRHSPELARAENEARLAATQARAEDHERHPDPTLGLQLGRASSGRERFVGLSLSVPLAGAYREAGAQAAARRAEAAQARAEALRLSLQAEAAARLQTARSTQAAARLMLEAARHQQDVAQALERAYELGEGSLQDALNARRQAHEQELQARLAAVDALAAHWTLRLESGLLWAAPEAEQEGG